MRFNQYASDSIAYFASTRTELLLLQNKDLRIIKMFWEYNGLLYLGIWLPLFLWMIFNMSIWIGCN